MLAPMIPPRPHVLVAEDDPDLLEVVVRLLEGHGHVVETALDGVQAVRAFEASPAVAVVVLDAGVGPRGAGEVLDAIVAHRPETGVVLTSGDALDGSLRQTLFDHAGIFLRKPFPARALFQAVVDSLDKDGPA